MRIERVGSKPYKRNIIGECGEKTGPQRSPLERRARVGLRRNLVVDPEIPDGMRGMLNEPRWRTRDPAAKLRFVFAHALATSNISSMLGISPRSKAIRFFDTQSISAPIPRYAPQIIGLHWCGALLTALRTASSPGVSIISMFGDSDQVVTNVSAFGNMLALSLRHWFSREFTYTRGALTWINRPIPLRSNFCALPVCKSRRTAALPDVDANQSGVRPVG
jgi:hypothetical protein